MWNCFDLVQNATSSHLILKLIASGSVLYWVTLVLYQHNFRKLKHIPNAAGTDLPFLSFFGVLKFLLRSHQVLNNAVDKWPRSMFKVPDPLQWKVIATDPKVIDEIVKAPDRILSFEESITELLQFNYTFGNEILSNPYHVPIIRVKLTRALPELVPEVHDEVVLAFNELIPVTGSEEWITVKALNKVMQIVCRASNRIFVGLPLCRDPDYVKLNIEFTLHVVRNGTILRLFPNILRPLVNSMISNIPKHIRRAQNHISPQIDARRKSKAEKSEQPLDVLNWLMEETEDVLDLAMRILSVNFGAIHSSSMTFTHTLYYLAAYPEYLAPLAQEADDAIKLEGWTKAALDKMHKIDSFLKESQRLSPIVNIHMERVVVADHTFSDGTFVPKGTPIAVAAHNTHYNPEIFPDPYKFEGFRFSKLKEGDIDGDKKFSMSSLSNNTLSFGNGRHACPGRHFASCELKLMLAYLVLNYEVKFEDGVRPADLCIGTVCIPNPKAKVLFRRRRVAA